MFVADLPTRYTKSFHALDVFHVFFHRVLPIFMCCSPGNPAHIWGFPWLSTLETPVTIGIWKTGRWKPMLWIHEIWAKLSRNVISPIINTDKPKTQIPWQILKKWWNTNRENAMVFLGSPISAASRALSKCTLQRPQASGQSRRR